MLHSATRCHYSTHFLRVAGTSRAMIFKAWSLISSINVTLELVRNAYSWLPSRPESNSG